MLLNRKNMKKLLRRIRNRILEEIVFLEEKKEIFAALFFRPDYLLAMIPLHGNMGDQAIVLSEVEWIKKNDEGARILEVSDIGLDKHKWLYRHVLKKWRNEITILITGGGFMGNLWPEEERRVLYLLEEFPYIKTVILPQTIYFDITLKNGECQRDFSRKIYQNHEKLTICCREHNSYLWIKGNCPEIKCVEIPDMVTHMCFTNNDMERRNILFCMRKDCEKAVSSDFLNNAKDMTHSFYPEEKICDIDTVNHRAGYVTRRRREYLFRRKIEDFSSAKLVITDRLHGMLFSAVTGTPCIAIDNRSGKVRGVYAWIKNCEYVSFVTSKEEFLHALESIDIYRKYQFKNDEILPYFARLYELIKS